MSLSSFRPYKTKEEVKKWRQRRKLQKRRLTRKRLKRAANLHAGVADSTRKGVD